VDHRIVGDQLAQARAHSPQYTLFLLSGAGHRCGRESIYEIETLFSPNPATPFACRLPDLLQDWHKWMFVALKV